MHVETLYQHYSIKTVYISIRFSLKILEITPENLLMTLIHLNTWHFGLPKIFVQIPQNTKNYRYVQYELNCVWLILRKEKWNKYFAVFGRLMPFWYIWRLFRSKERPNNETGTKHSCHWPISIEKVYMSIKFPISEELCSEIQVKTHLWCLTGHVALWHPEPPEMFF